MFDTVETAGDSRLPFRLESTLIAKLLGISFGD